MLSKSQHLRAGAVWLQPEGLLEGWRERRSGSMLYDDEEPEAALAHGSFRRTGDANPPICGLGGTHFREPGPEPRAGPAHSLGLSPEGCEPFCETVPCSRNQRRLASAPLGEQD